MAEGFNRLRLPNLLLSLNKRYGQGAHPYAVQNLLALAVLTLNDELLHVESRHPPRISISRGRAKNQRVLTLTLTQPLTRRKRTKQIPITLDFAAISLADESIPLANETGPARLLNALVDVIEDFWTNYGR